ncbi:MAG: exonuclease SbcCD subunit D [Candidatus Promineifilaceae bacterium]
MTHNQPIRLLHFADAHIDMANYGRHDPLTSLPVRVMDFLRALDQIVDRAIQEKVDLVLFAGDAYKDRNPQPTFQREWGKRIMRLSQAGIPTVLLVGNHDVSPASGRAHTLHEFETLAVPHIHVADRITLLGPQHLGLPVQIITVPWVSRNALMTREEMIQKEVNEVLGALEERVGELIQRYIQSADPNLPLIVMAHTSVQGATYGSERMVMLGQELVLTPGLLRDKRLDYVALGHIHQHQSLNGTDHPPIVYPGSIERIDFGEAREAKGFVLAEVQRGQTHWEFVKLAIRHFMDLQVEPAAAESFMVDIINRLPPPDKVVDAICRLQLTYPRDWESLLDEAALNQHFAGALSFQMQKHRLAEKRARLGDAAAVQTLSPLELLTLYWQSVNMGEEDAAALQTLAQEIFPQADSV